MEPRWVFADVTHRPWPCLASSSSKLFDPPTRTRWNSSLTGVGKGWGGCSPPCPASHQFGVEHLTDERYAAAAAGTGLAAFDGDGGGALATAWRCRPLET